jgi:adenine phosphoribosyltransferase
VSGEAARNADLAALVGAIPDFPKPGIMFRDVSSLIADGPGFRAAVDRLLAEVDPDGIDLIAGVEARGFIVAAAMAYALAKGKLMIRKAGKLPGATIGIDYALEYGSDRLEVRAGSIRPGQRVLIVDDLLATGGTVLAGAKLLRNQGAVVDRALFLVDLPALGGVARLREAGLEPFALIAFDGE